MPWSLIHLYPTIMSDHLLTPFITQCSAVLTINVMSNNQREFRNLKCHCNSNIHKTHSHKLLRLLKHSNISIIPVYSNFEITVTELT